MNVKGMKNYVKGTEDSHPTDEYKPVGMKQRQKHKQRNNPKKWQNAKTYFSMNRIYVFNYMYIHSIFQIGVLSLFTSSYQDGLSSYAFMLSALSIISLAFHRPD